MTFDVQVDGKEHGLLRKSSGIAFGLCLLYAWLDAMSTGGAKWWRYWRDTLFAYKMCASSLVILLFQALHRFPSPISNP